ncbi:DUF3152 domain-containing protein [Oerskovia paurometabola]|uniref:DUF3152 domain-containing protein n=1 Tax=Oerskovia paurometabola TaxID=162170 RepID=A0ABW1XDV9_9CELL|nr:DUF3152 domain-containing protein [Oerskovia paurometabola]MBM7496648.1 hypothetical protein [Oerskovia paurometabola]
MRRGPAAAFVVAGVLGGLGAGVLGVGSLIPGAPTGPVAPAASGATDRAGGDGVGQEGAAPEASAGSAAGGTASTDGAADARSEDPASRSVRDPLVGLDGPGSLPLPLERVVEEGSGLVGREVVPDLGGALTIVPAEVPAPGAGTVRRVRVEVEQGLPVDGETFAAAVLATLNDPRGWSAVDGVTFARTGGDADIRVVLASPATTDRLCAPLQTEGAYSCGVTGAAILNFSRWVNGATDFGQDLPLYRQYLVNHEVGHVLGHRHVSCPAPGALAPVMVQQSMSTEGCLPNGWPTL